ncbi:MAG: DUF1080 domain-containing protein [Gemmataceae bacterium]
MRSALLSFTSVITVVALGLAAEDKKPAGHNVPPKGFTALFNGKDLTHWQGVIPINQRAKLKENQEEYAKRVKAQNAKVFAHWKIQPDGVLYYDGKGDSLQTIKDYGNFELLIDWKIEEKGDSGIYLRGQPQVQIWDSDNAAGARGADKSSGSGALWNNPEKFGKRPLKKADKPIGEWNSFRIIMKGEKVTVYLNGVLVVDNQPLMNFWDKNQPLPKKGPIELQHHGDRLWFRNIFIKELPDNVD